MKCKRYLTRVTLAGLLCLLTTLFVASAASSSTETFIEGISLSHSGDTLLLYTTSDGSQYSFSSIHLDDQLKVAKRQRANLALHGIAALSHSGNKLAAVKGIDTSPTGLAKMLQHGEPIAYEIYIQDKQGKKLHKIKNPSDISLVHDILWTHDDSRLLVIGSGMSDTTTIHVYDHNLKLLEAWPFPEFIQSLALSPSNQYLGFLAKENENTHHFLHVMDLTTGKVVNKLPQLRGLLNWCYLDDETILFFQPHPQDKKKWVLTTHNLETGATEPLLGPDAPGFTPNHGTPGNRHKLTLGKNQVAVQAEDGVYLVDCKGKTFRKVLDKTELDYLTLSGDGNTLAYVTQNVPWVKNLETGKEARIEKW